MLGHRLPVFREVLLGDAGPQLAVGVGEGDALDGRVRALRLAGGDDGGAGLGGGGVARGRSSEGRRGRACGGMPADQVWRFLACHRRARRHRRPRRYRRRRPSTPVIVASGRWLQSGSRACAPLRGWRRRARPRAAGLSSRRPRYTAWRTRPAPDQRQTAISATSSGRTQWIVLSSGSPATSSPRGGSVGQRVERCCAARQLVVGEAGADAAGIVQPMPSDRSSRDAARRGRCGCRAAGSSRAPRTPRGPGISPSASHGRGRSDTAHPRACR